MKLTASILLLTILAFNWVGYRFVSNYFQNKADREIQASISNSTYNDADLIEFRIPLNTPYYSGTRDFESFNGDVEIEGVHYNYVKRKIERGELVLLCLPNEIKTRIQHLSDNFFKLVNDLNDSSQTKNKSTVSSLKTFTTEYREENNSWFIKPVMPDEVRHLAADDENHLAGFICVLRQPPRA